MTKKDADKIKKVLRAENAVFTSTAGYYDGEELRVKVTEYANRSYLNGKTFTTDNTQREKETREHIIKVLRALEKNGLRPPYRIERKESTNAIGAFDCTYVIFK